MPEPVDLAEIVAGRAEAWSALAEERGVRLATSSSGATVARAAPDRLEQVLDNLLSNALEVSPPGGTIRLATARDGDRVEVHVVDEGPGLSPEQRELSPGELRAAAPHGIDAVVLLPAATSPSRARERTPS